MSRIAKMPVPVPTGVDVRLGEREIVVKGKGGELHLPIPADVRAAQQGDEIVFSAESTPGAAMRAGTTRALVANMVHGVSKGFERKLELVGVGYRAQAKGNTLSLTLGYSHPIEYRVPQGITIETPSQTEIVIKGIDRQKVGQVAAEIRAWRPPEPYKGKGVKYAGEAIVRKEAKKK